MSIRCPHILVGECRDMFVVLGVVAAVGTVETRALVVEHITEVTPVCQDRENKDEMPMELTEEYTEI